MVDWLSIVVDWITNYDRILGCIGTLSLSPDDVIIDSWSCGLIMTESWAVWSLWMNSKVNCSNCVLSETFISFSQPIRNSLSVTWWCWYRFLVMWTLPEWYCQQTVIRFSIIFFNLQNMNMHVWNISTVLVYYHG